MEMRGGWLVRRLAVTSPLTGRSVQVTRGGVQRKFVWSVICLLSLCPTTRARGDTFKLVSALQSEVLSEDNKFQSAQAGQTIGEPWRFRTGPEGRLLVSSVGLQLELQPLSEVSLDEVKKSHSKDNIQSYLKPGTEPPKNNSLPAPLLTLHRGTLFVQAGLRPVSLETKFTRVDARYSVFAFSTSATTGELLSVLKGQVKVTDANKKVTFVPAGNSLRLALGAPPVLSLLNEQAESQEHIRVLTTLESSTPEETPTSISSQEVGAGAQTPFDLTQRRRAVLLTAPNPFNIGRPDVSPELPNSDQPNP